MISPKNNIVDYIGLDVLYDVLAFLDRKELAFGVEIASKLFKSIIDRTRLNQFPFLKIHSILNISHFYMMPFCCPKYGGLMKRHCMQICVSERRRSHNVLWKMFDKPPPYLRFDNIFIIPKNFYKQPSPLAIKFNPNAPTKLSAKRINALKRMGHCFEQSKVQFEMPFELFFKQQLLGSSNLPSPLDINNLNLLLEIFLQIFTNCNQIQFCLPMDWDFYRLINSTSFTVKNVPKTIGFGVLFKNASILNCSNLCLILKYDTLCWSPWEHPQIPLFDIEYLNNWLHSESGKSRSLIISFNLINVSHKQSANFVESLLAILTKEMMSSGTMPFSYNLLIYCLPDKVEFKWREYVHQENPKTGEKLIVKLGRREFYGCRTTNFVRIQRF